MSFATFAPPPKRTVHVKAEDTNGAKVDFYLVEPDVPLIQSASVFGIEIVKQFVPKSRRVNVKPAKDDPEPTDFPQSGLSGPIVLDETSVFEIANLFYFQDTNGLAFNDALSTFKIMPFAEFVYMRNVAPKCYQACQRALYAAMEGQDLEGNLTGGSGSASLDQQPPSTLAVTLTSLGVATTSQPESTTESEEPTNF